MAATIGLLGRHTELSMDRWINEKRIENKFLDSGQDQQSDY
jgi:hypothetical protein